MVSALNLGEAYGGPNQIYHNLDHLVHGTQLWLAFGLPATKPAEVADLIRVTDHARQHALDHPLKHVMLGADLAILGQSEAIYKTYTQSVRNEYAWVDELAYRAGRKAVLQHFLATFTSKTSTRPAQFAIWSVKSTLFKNFIKVLMAFIQALRAHQ